MPSKSWSRIFLTCQWPTGRCSVTFCLLTFSRLLFLTEHKESKCRRESEPLERERGEREREGGREGVRRRSSSGHVSGRLSVGCASWPDLRGDLRASFPIRPVQLFVPGSRIERGRSVQSTSGQGQFLNPGHEFDRLDRSSWTAHPSRWKLYLRDNATANRSRDTTALPLRFRDHDWKFKIIICVDCNISGPNHAVSILPRFTEPTLY